MGLHAENALALLPGVLATTRSGKPSAHCVTAALVQRERRKLQSLSPAVPWNPPVLEPPEGCRCSLVLPVQTESVQH